jgi:chromosome segregation ATPase
MNDHILAAGPIAAKIELPSGSEMTAQKVLTQATGLRINTDEDYGKAADFANDCKRMGEKEDADRVELKKDFLAGCRRIDAYFKRPIELYDQAFKAVKEAMKRYDERKREALKAEQKRLDDARRQEEEAQKKRREAEERARREAQEKVDAEARARTEAAEAEARKAREAQAAAEAQARGDREAAEAATRRANAAEEDARKANEQAKTDREAAIEARRKQLKAERETQAGADAVSAATTAATTQTTELDKVAGVSRKTVWKYRVRKQDGVPRNYLTPNFELIQTDVDRLKERAQEVLGDWLEVYSEQELAVGKKRGA